MIKLINKRRFLPFFITQFSGAFNDSIFKSALLVFLVISFTDSKMISLYSNLAMVLFIAPMFLASAWSGLLADRFEKQGLIFKIKLLEVCIMLLGITSFLTQQVWMMLGVLFLLGLQSTFFGPVKYGILAERLQRNELMLANGLVEAGTFLAILLGTLLGSYLVYPKDEMNLTGGIDVPIELIIVMIISTSCGIISAILIPKGEQPIEKPKLPAYRPWKQSKVLIQYTAHYRDLFQSILAISWFWFLGGALLTEIPQYSKEVLGGDPTVTTYFLVLFSIGIGLGSLSAQLFSRGRIEPGLVPFAGIMIAAGLCGIVLIKKTPDVQTLMTLSQFYHYGNFWQTTWAFFLMAFGGGVFVVPLYALLQSNAELGHKSQIIAANNIFNTIFMIVANIISLIILSLLGWSVQMLFAMFLIAHIAITAYIFWVVPGFILWIFAKLITKLNYRVKVTGKRNIPKDGAAYLICNHVSYLDPVIIWAVARRPIRFVMYHKIYHAKPLNWLFRLAHCIPIAPRHECEETYQQALKSVKEAIDEGYLVGIFPEGKLTLDGEINVFREGITRMLEIAPAPIIPMAIGNLWGGFFTHKDGLCKKPMKKWMAEVPLTIGEPLEVNTSSDEMRDIVERLLLSSINDEKIAESC